MDKNLKMIFNYHNRTKHYYARYAKSIGFMDWANQPDPFRSYEEALHVELPLASNNSTPPYSSIFTDDLPSSLLSIDSISQLFQFSLGISAIKSSGDSVWALRCNASSGNLHPSEAYLILPPIDGISELSTLSHYSPKDHSLEVLKSFNTDIWDNVQEGTFLFALSSIVYREVWKYGERAFRYVMLDIGHAQRAVEISAKILGWKVGLLKDIDDNSMCKILGYNQIGRIEKKEHEIPEIFLQISPDKIKKTVNMDVISSNTKLPRANRLAPDYQDWELIDEIINATNSSIETKLACENIVEYERHPTKNSKTVVLERRSAQMMNKEDSKIDYEQFITIMKSTKISFLGLQNVANLIIFVHNVDGLKQGLYLYARVNHTIGELKKALKSDFIWEEIDDDLYLLNYGDYREISKQISCSQSIASDGVFSLGMLCRFSDEISKYGEHRYKELFWECGAIGQQLYIEATSLGLSATGIGCFLDDAFHELLGLKTDTFQSLYHFTIGRAIVDKRVKDIVPYSVR